MTPTNNQLHLLVGKVHDHLADEIHALEIKVAKLGAPQEFADRMATLKQAAEGMIDQHVLSASRLIVGACALAPETQIVTGKTKALQGAKRIGVLYAQLSTE